MTSPADGGWWSRWRSRRTTTTGQPLNGGNAKRRSKGGGGRVAGQVTSTWARTFSVTASVTAGDHTVVIIERSDGGGASEVTATVDGHRVPVAVAVTADGRRDGWHHDESGESGGGGHGQGAPDTLALIAEIIGRHHPDAVRARFDTTEWDNGFFFTSYPEIEQADGQRIPYGADDLANHATELSLQFGPLGRDAWLLLNVRTMAVDFDQYSEM